MSSFESLPAFTLDQLADHMSDHSQVLKFEDFRFPLKNLFAFSPFLPEKFRLRKEAPHALGVFRSRVKVAPVAYDTDDNEIICELADEPNIQEEHRKLLEKLRADVQGIYQRTETLWKKLHEPALAWKLAERPLWEDAQIFSRISTVLVCVQEMLPQIEAEWTAACYRSTALGEDQTTTAAVWTTMKDHLQQITDHLDECERQVSEIA